MDPFSALSVAANIVQFIVYGINIVSKGSQLYKSADGALVENAELEEATIRLQQLSTTFQEVLDQSLPQGLSKQNDQNIRKICVECKAVSKELVEKLEGLKIPEGHPHKRWKSFRQALKSVWTKESIEDIAQRLSQLRLELDGHVLLSLREQVTVMSIQQNARFTSLENESKKIMLALLANNEALVAAIESNFRTLSLSSQKEHAKPREILYAHAENSYRRKAELHILESLRFETMTYRYETISEAHKRTFEWIFRDPDAEGKPWSSFIKWAESGSGIYWINGKAGSGKSTLMRFIVDDPRTQSHLQQWAPRENLITPAFFFWNSGVPKQKSQAALLRSIIYEVVKKAHRLLSGSIPRRMAEGSGVVETRNITNTRDEYDGDHEEIANYFSDLSSLPYIKFCIASRPLTVFKDSFSTRPALRLQDLTSQDIEIYVKDKLNSHKRMKLLTEKDSRNSNYLVHELIAKAEGVFLWVTLVVKTLLKGLGQRDGFPQLLKRLNSFPSELEQLYGHMLNLIDPIYMAEGAKLFRIYKVAAEMSRRVTAEDLYIAHIFDLPRVLGATSDDLQRARNEEVRFSNIYFLKDFEFSIYESECLSEYMDHMLRTRYGSLIEINGNDRERVFAGYLHRTVSDYLDREDVWEAICRYETEDATFEPALQLLMCQVLHLKRLSISKILGLEYIKEAIYRIWLKASTISRFCMYCKTIDVVKIRNRLLHEFDYQATDLFRKVNSLEPKNQQLQHWSNYRRPSNWHFDFLCETIRCGLLFYVETQILSDQGLLERQSSLPLIGFTFLTNGFVDVGDAQLKVLEFLLEQGADPNETFMSHTMWQYFVHYLHTLSPGPIGRRKDFIMWHEALLKKIVEKFLKRGASLDICCIDDGEIWDQVSSYDTTAEYLGELKVLFDFLKRHVGYYKNSKIKAFKQVESNTDFNAPVSTSFASSLGPAIVEKGSVLEECPIEEIERIAFEECHSLPNIFRELFETEDDPYGADELLELMATLKATKQVQEDLQS